MSPQDQITDLVRRVSAIEQQNQIAAAAAQKAATSQQTIATAHQGNINTMRSILQAFGNRIAAAEKMLGIKPADDPASTQPGAAPPPVA